MPTSSAVARIGLGLIVLSCVAMRPRVQAASQAGAPTIDFGKDIRPILAAKCLSCHGEPVKLSGLDLRTRESALAGGTHGSVLVPGSAEQSRLYRMAAGLERPAMPMQGAALTSEELAALEKWIDEGAPWDAGGTSPSLANASTPFVLETRPLSQEERDYWAFKPPRQTPPPRLTRSDLTNPIDRFLEQARAERGLTPAPRADRLTLVRRAYLDLIGLPPSPSEVDAFLADTAPGAWGRLVDKLLASPHYGERYGRHWLDVARYADSAGFEYDFHRPNAWRYRDYVIRSFNDDKPYDVFLVEQIAGDEMDGKTQDSVIATGFLRAGPRVLFREKDNPERRYDYLDEILGTIGKGTLGLTINCARCHDHKFDPIRQRDYYALEASIFGYVETEVPLVPPAEAQAYLAANEEINVRSDELRKLVSALEKPHRARLELEQIKSNFSDAIYRAAAKPEAERSPGEKLLATQVYEAVNVPGAQIDKVMTPEELARKKDLIARIEALERQRPKPVPMAEIVTDGDYRFAPLGAGDDVVSCPKCRIPPPFPGSYLHKGPAPYEAPPSYFLIRGDVQSPGPQMQPGFIEVLTHGNPPTSVPRPDGRTSGRRLALARWIASRENPLTARVIVNRIWQKHFGRGIVPTLENFGKMGGAPSHPELLDWMAVEFMNGGWSLKRITRLMMMSEAYQMASAFENAADARGDPESVYLWRFRPQRLEAEIVRDTLLTVGGNINLAVGGEPVFPFIPKEILAGQFRGKWETTPDGPAGWRRGVYVYRRRSLPYPMFDTFDHPDMNAVAGARNVSTVPTQALTLLNNPFVLSQARRLAERVSREAQNPLEQVNLAYRIALARPATEQELAVATDLIRRESLVSFTHVLVNLSEFLYLR